MAFPSIAYSTVNHSCLVNTSNKTEKNFYVGKSSINTVFVQELRFLGFVFESKIVSRFIYKSGKILLKDWIGLVEILDNLATGEEHRIMDVFELFEIKNHKIENAHNCSLKLHKNVVLISQIIFEFNCSLILYGQSKQFTVELTPTKD